MKRFITIFVICFCFSVVNIFAQKPIKFTSLYTNLNKDCKPLKGGEGQDTAFDCKGIGGYRISLSPSAAALSITAQTPDKKDSIPLANQSIGFDQTKVKLEWRLANGKPFAVIMRIDKYGKPENDYDIFGKKIGTELVVIGLKGFDKIDFKVDGKTANATANARKLADNAFLRK